MPTYKELLFDPRWQKKRLEILSRDNFTCQGCGNKEKTLHVHHKRYIPKKFPWECPDGLLITLCSNCHEDEKSAREEYLSGLIELVKDLFLSSEIFTLTSCMVEIFRRIELYNIKPKLLVESLDYFLSNDANIDSMIMDYEEYLEKRETKWREEE